MVQRIYFEEGGPEWTWWERGEIVLPEDRNRLHVKDGYTLDDLDHVARVALSRNRGSRLPGSERYDIAYSAAVLRLLESDTQPDLHELTAAASRALANAAHIEDHHHGYDGDRRRSRFTAYWAAVAGSAPSMEDRIVERLALSQVWSTLTPAQQEALGALAATGTQGAAAAALDIAPTTLSGRISTGRRRAYTLWFEGESAPTTPRDHRVKSYSAPPQEYCRRGHKFTPENTRMQQRRGGGRPYRRCMECTRIRDAQRRTHKDQRD